MLKKKLLRPQITSSACLLHNELPNSADRKNIFVEEFTNNWSVLSETISAETGFINYKSDKNRKILLSYLRKSD